jgi:4-amino-4-deoxy-L-arabinose transferase-like glycosyltransferase
MKSQVFNGPTNTDTHFHWENPDHNHNQRNPTYIKNTLLDYRSMSYELSLLVRAIFLFALGWIAHRRFKYGYGRRELPVMIAFLALSLVEQVFMIVLVNLWYRSTGPQRDVVEFLISIIIIASFAMALILFILSVVGVICIWFDVVEPSKGKDWDEECAVSGDGKGVSTGFGRA